MAKAYSILTIPQYAALTYAHYAAMLIDPLLLADVVTGTTEAVELFRATRLAGLLDRTGAVEQATYTKALDLLDRTKEVDEQRYITVVDVEGV